MHPILSSYIPLLLLFTISFSSKSDRQEIQKPILENEIVPFIPQPNSVKLNDYFIYPSNDKFKNDILPFLSSEILLKIYFHFRNLYPNVSIEKFLPDSRFRVETTVLNLQKSYYPAYIFKNEFSFFSPIIFDSEQDYRTVTLGCRDNNVEEDTIYALFSSNKIFAFQSYDLPNNQNAFAAFDDTLHFLAAEKKVHGNLTAIAFSKFPMVVFLGDKKIEFFDFLDCIVEAHNLNCFKKAYFKVFDLHQQWWVFVEHVLTKGCPLLSFPAKILYAMFFLAFLYIGYFPIYHVQMLPFYILSFPFEFFLFQHNFEISGIFTKNFVVFWTLPCSFSFIAYFSHIELYFVEFKRRYFSDEGFFNIFEEIKPQKIKWAVQYCMEKKYNKNQTKEYIFPFLLRVFMFLKIFGLGFIYTLPLSPFMMIHGEANE